VIPRLAEYEEVVGQDVIQELLVLADRVRHLKMQHINSTPVGGGVAEILTRLVPLMGEVGVTAAWDVIKGDQAFFEVTKAIHNALHGKGRPITQGMWGVYQANTEMNLAQVNFTGDVIVIHDPQPAGLIQARKKVGRQWIWRCHIDVSTPDEGVWESLRPNVERFDAAVFSMPEFARQMAIPQYLITPSIDPLSDKNRDLPRDVVNETLARHGIDPDRPVLTQISRFDRLKDPLGVIAAYKMVKRRQDCQLVLAGGGADDDPEGAEVLSEVRERAGADRDIHVILLPPLSDLEINALVRGSTIVIQKSLREGFGLTVSEALWKKKAVIGGAVGGIKIQILNGVTGYLVRSPEGTANRVLELLRNPRLCRQMGENGHQHVKQNFLLTRNLKDYLLLMLAIQHLGEHVVNLA
jgi:trehalose synthase